MSLQAQASYRVLRRRPIARTIFRKGTWSCACMTSWRRCFRTTSLPTSIHGGTAGGSALRLAFVTLLQFMEGLTDRQAADAVRTRIDWKYLLCLELDDPRISSYRAQ